MTSAAGLRPVLALLAGFWRRRLASLVRLHVSQLHPLAPTRYHRRYALLLARLEGPALTHSVNHRTCCGNARVIA